MTTPSIEAIAKALIGLLEPGGTIAALESEQALMSLWTPQRDAQELFGPTPSPSYIAKYCRDFIIKVAADMDTEELAEGSALLLALGLAAGYGVKNAPKSRRINLAAEKLEMEYDALMHRRQGTTNLEVRFRRFAELLHDEDTENESSGNFLTPLPPPLYRFANKPALGRDSYAIACVYADAMSTDLDIVFRILRDEDKNEQSFAHHLDMALYFYIGFWLAVEKMSEQQLALWTLIDANRDLDGLLHIFPLPDEVTRRELERGLPDMEHYPPRILLEAAKTMPSITMYRDIFVTLFERCQCPLSAPDSSTCSIHMVIEAGHRFQTVTKSDWRASLSQPSIGSPSSTTQYS
jgi:hypothetical protein